jgi:hypothetical protein
MRFDPQTHSQMLSARGFSYKTRAGQSPRAHEARIMLFYTDWMGLLWKFPALHLQGGSSAESFKAKFS